MKCYLNYYFLYSSEKNHFENNQQMKNGKQNPSLQKVKAQSGHNPKSKVSRIHVLSCVRCGAWLYRFLIFAFLLTSRILDGLISFILDGLVVLLYCH